MSGGAVRTVTAATMVALAVAACHNPNRDDKPSPESTASPPLPPSPPSPSAVTTSGAAGAALAGVKVDAQTPLHDGAVACHAMTVTGGPPGHGPEYILMNTGNVDMKACKVVFYAYDADGKQLARAQVEPISRASTDMLKPTQSVRSVLDTADAARAAMKQGTTWQAVVTEVRFADGNVWSSPERAPAIRPRQTE